MVPERLAGRFSSMKSQILCWVGSGVRIWGSWKRLLGRCDNSHPNTHVCTHRHKDIQTHINTCTHKPLHTDIGTYKYTLAHIQAHIPVNT